MTKWQTIMAKIDRRKEARGKDCMIRLVGICNFNPDTTVLAHYRLADYCGASLKPDDDMGSWACSACHDAVDGRVSKYHGYSRQELRLCHAEGVMRTWMARKKQ